MADNPSAESLPDIERRVRRLEDAEALRTLKARYCAACDDGYDADAIARLFTEDGVWDGSPTFERVVGRGAIRAYFSTVGARMPFARHQVMNPDIVVAADGFAATGRWLLFQPCTSVERGPLWLSADYSDSYAKVDGEWLIAQSCIDVSFFVPYASGWSSEVST